MYLDNDIIITTWSFCILNFSLSIWKNKLTVYTYIIHSHWHNSPLGAWKGNDIELIILTIIHRHICTDCVSSISLHSLSPQITPMPWSWASLLQAWASVFWEGVMSTQKLSTALCESRKSSPMDLLTTVDCKWEMWYYRWTTSNSGASLIRYWWLLTCKKTLLSCLESPCGLIWEFKWEQGVYYCSINGKYSILEAVLYDCMD